MRVIVMGKIRDRFPDTYQNVTPRICYDGKVLDLCVQPAKREWCTSMVSHTIGLVPRARS